VEFTIAQHGRHCAGLKLFALSTTETRHSNVRSLISRDALSLAAKVRRALREKLASSALGQKNHFLPLEGINVLHCKFIILSLCFGERWCAQQLRRATSSSSSSQK